MALAGPLQLRPETDSVDALLVDNTQPVATCGRIEQAD
jgi:hypothetical protein